MISLPLRVITVTFMLAWDLGIAICNAIKVIDFDFDFDFGFVGDTFKNGVGAFKGLVETLMGCGG